MFLFLIYVLIPYTFQKLPVPMTARSKA